MAGTHALKRIPRIKFPQRHPKPSSETSTPATDDTLKAFLSRSASSNSSLSASGKASDQPKRVPVSKDEIEAILLGGCI
ncbi:hypothetical protein BVRB_5g098790 [Beta vulgaris subsp. vulgaris]|uniref:uncharacterized protein LOC104892150 n=1 Tax=Beta vulgaris subsp. vulgaris TaxID=3555 RepID=UPI00053FBF02|nr:uncharacterized protein LOC104892150 [Beta vulgaris subsp. vulgaris]KMT11914.1 hypothetical protein BVRB_5g098790 [Beta vulgaris subsp. vulgaris]